MKNMDGKVMRKIVFTFTFTLVNFLSTMSSSAFDYPEPGDFALGAQQWADNCTRCHNMRGPNELRDDQWIATMFHMRVRAGLTGDQTRNILTFIQDSNNSPVGATPVSTSNVVSGKLDANISGKEIYDQTCIACHGAKGTGAIPGVPDFTDASGRLSQPDDVLLVNIVRGLQSPGSTMAMPAKGGNPLLSEDDIRAVIEYLRSAFGT